MRMIDADRLYAQVAETRYPTITGIMRMVQDAPTVGGWHDAKQEMPKRENMYLVCFYNGDFFTGGISRWDGDSFFRPDGTRADVPDYWMEFPAPPEVKA